VFYSSEASNGDLKVVTKFNAYFNGSSINLLIFNKLYNEKIIL